VAVVPGYHRVTSTRPGRISSNPPNHDPTSATVRGADTSHRLCALIPRQSAQVLADSGDPIDILATAIGQNPNLGAALDAELTSIELTAAAQATGSGYVHEALAACRDSGRTPAVIGRQAADAIRTYLAKHGLIDQTALVIAPGSYPPGHLQTLTHLVEDTIGALATTPAECALITASPAGIDAAHSVGAHIIGYARTPADREHLAHAGATCVIPSLADLTLRLRARPLPN
jgi:beta-phosphoglucomutase-like phosphatase (HAD superfamily)